MRPSDLTRRLAEAPSTDLGLSRALSPSQDDSTDEVALPPDDETQQPVRFCTGTACTFAGGLKLQDRLAGIAGASPVRCLGTRHDAPPPSVATRSSAG
ncbi:MAG: hypothetical protein IPI35_34320 [Deltaproteobacteria bacterium]|nr:hypothetical protein [Deltaproteobacteria bacterium]